jgi:hypothetical protein
MTKESFRHDLPLAILRVRFGHGHPRRVGDLACRSPVDRKVMVERFPPRRSGRPHIRHIDARYNRQAPPLYSPWDIEDNGSCFIVRHANGQALSYVYYETEPGRRTAANLLTRDEARRIAMNIAKLPDLLGAAVEQEQDGNALTHRRP